MPKQEVITSTLFSYGDNFRRCLFNNYYFLLCCLFICNFGLRNHQLPKRNPGDHSIFYRGLNPRFFRGNRGFAARFSKNRGFVKPGVCKPLGKYFLLIYLSHFGISSRF